MLVFLVGFSGSGKTFWGEKWAEAFALQYYDLDEYIAEEQDQTVSEIFEKKGEMYFRKLEKEALEKFLDRENMIVSCGGGVPCFFDNMEKMNNAGTTLYLKADAEFLYERLILEMEKRPLLSRIPPAEVFDFIKNKLSEREPFYNKAKITVDATSLTEKTFADILVPLPKIS